MKSLGNLKGSLRYKYVNATPTNIKEALRDWPVGVHFAMHGHHMKQEDSLKHAKEVKNYEKYCGFKKEGGDFLLFEANDSSAVFFHEKEIEDTFSRKICEQIDFVVITSCYSELIGKKFRELGVSHVICISKNHPLDDEAAIIFS